MKIRVLLTSILVVSANLVAWGISAQEQQGPSLLVEVDAVKSEMITARLWVPGSVLSVTDSELAAEVAGRIMWMAEAGARVDKGSPLIKLNDKRLKIDFAQAKSNIAMSQTRVELLTSRLARFSTMAALQNTSADELDGIRSELEVAQQELAQAQISAEMIEYEIEQSTVRAPFDALVVERIQSPGEFTGIGQVLMRVVDPTQIEATVRAPLSVIPYLNAGASVPVKNGEQVSQQTIRAIIPVGNARSRMMELRIALNADDFVIGGALRVGLPNSTAHYGHTVPRDALVLRQSGTFVYQLGEDNMAKQVVVDTGVGLGDRVEVISADLIPDSLVVVRGAERLKDGDEVRVKDKDPVLAANR